MTAESGSRRIMKVRECETPEEMRDLVQSWLDRLPVVQHDSWWMEARAALYRLAALATVATEHGVPIQKPRD